MAKKKEIIKTADASFAAKVRDPNILVCRSLSGPCNAHLPERVVEFGKDGTAEVTREEAAAYFWDTTRFAFDVPAPETDAIGTHEA
jgi:hypothetical protein